MAFWFLLLLVLGLATYLIVERSVARITRTPVWLLWLVLMIPAFILSTWTLKYGLKVPPPTAIIIWPSIICLFLYWSLFHWGRRNLVEKQSATTLPPTNLPSVQSEPIRPIAKVEETQLRNCFPWSVYYIQNIEYRPQAVICRGQLRASSHTAYQQVKANIETQFGDRFLLIFQEGLNNQPFFVLVPNTQLARQSENRDKEKLTHPGIALLLLLMTLITTTIAGIKFAGIDVKSLENNFTLALKGLPYALGLISILGIHELGHYLTARFYKIRATLPYFIPVPFFLGTFGAFIQMRSPTPNRKALFDISIAGPIAGFIVTLPLLLWGLAHSEVVSMRVEPDAINPKALDPKYSLLLALLAKLALGSQLKLNSAIDLHPIAIAGFLGLIVTALNLIPVGQLDGGHIVHAMFGQRTAMIIGQISRFLLLLLSLIKGEFWIWTIIVFFFIPLIDEPALNDVTGLDNRRDLLGLLTLGLLVLIVIPLPQFFARLLFS